MTLYFKWTGRRLRRITHPTRWVCSLWKEAAHNVFILFYGVLFYSIFIQGDFNNTQRSKCFPVFTHVWEYTSENSNGISSSALDPSSLQKKVHQQSLRMVGLNPLEMESYYFKVSEKTSNREAQIILLYLNFSDWVSLSVMGYCDTCHYDLTPKHK